MARKRDPSKLIQVKRDHYFASLSEKWYIRFQYQIDLTLEATVHMAHIHKQKLIQSSQGKNYDIANFYTGLELEREKMGNFSVP